MTRFYCPLCRKFIPESSVYRSWQGPVHEAVWVAEGKHGMTVDLEETHKVKEVKS